MTSRLAKSISLLALVTLGGLTSCGAFPGVPSEPQATSPVTEQAPTTQEVSTPAPTAPSGAPQGLLAAGTALLDLTANVSASQDAKVELSFDSPAMQPVSIEVTLVAGAPAYQLNLVDKYGNFLATYESDPTKASELIPEVTLPYASTYKLVIVPQDGEGSVLAHVEALGAPTGGGDMEAGSSLQGLIGAPRTYHTYQFSLDQGQSVNIATKATEPGLDTSFVIYGPDGHYLTDADDINAPLVLDAQISDYVAPMTGTYTAVVTSKDLNTGGYTFSLGLGTEPPAAQGAADIVYDKDYRANFADKSNLSVTFDGSIGDVLKIEASEVEESLRLDLYLSSPFGQTIAFAVNPTKGRNTDINEVQLPYTGRYTLELRPFGDGQATFKLIPLTDPPTGGGVLTDELTKLPGSVTQANVFHVYQFEATAGDKVSLAAFSVSKGGTLDLGFALISPSGKQLLFADDSPSQFPKDPQITDYEIIQGGTYIVIVYSFTNATGTYDFVFTRK